MLSDSGMFNHCIFNMYASTCIFILFRIMFIFSSNRFAALNRLFHLGYKYNTKWICKNNLKYSL